MHPSTSQCDATQPDLLDIPAFSRPVWTRHQTAARTSHGDSDTWINGHRSHAPRSFLLTAVTTAMASAKPRQIIAPPGYGACSDARRMVGRLPTRGL